MFKLHENPAIFSRIFLERFHMTSHVRHIGVPKQNKKGGHVGVPNQSCGS